MALRRPPAVGTRMLPADTFVGETVFITGGGTGLGKAIASEFARCGASIAIASRGEEHRKAGVAQMQEIGAKAFDTYVDVRDPVSVSTAFDATEEALGPVTILINNAAGNFEVPAEKMSPNAWKSVVDIVLNGTFNCSREFGLRRIAAGGGGAILNIGATYSWTGGPGTAHSAAAKAGVTNLTQSLAVEWAPDDIRVNCLAPGYFPLPDRSDGGWVTPEGKAKLRRASTIPGQRVGEGQELGWAATYLCSPFAAYLTGHTLVLDGANWLRRNLRMPEFEPVREVYESSRQAIQTSKDKAK